MTTSSPAAPSRRPRRNTRALLMERALRLAAREGFTGTSVRTLCAEVGIRESSFYGHFASKSDLLRALLDQAGAGAALAILRNTCKDAPAASDFVAALTERLLTHWAEEPARAMRLILEHEAGRSPAFRDELNRGVTHFIDELATVLARFGAGQQIDIPTSPRASAWALVAPLAALRSTYLALGASDADRETATSLAHEHVRLWLGLHGIQGRTDVKRSTRAQTEHRKGRA